MVGDVTTPFNMHHGNSLFFEKIGCRYYMVALALLSQSEYMVMLNEKNHIL